MAFSQVSAAHKDAVGAIDKTIHEKGGIYSARAHYSNNAYMGRILKPAHPCRIRRRIAAPVTEKAENTWFI